jgi:hypothetical protein
MMARPAPEVITTIELNNGQTWQVLKASRVYVIIYRGEPASMRVIDGFGNHIYKKMTYTELGSARRQAKKLNHYFNCEDFTVAQVGD